VPRRGLLVLAIGGVAVWVAPSSSSAQTVPPPYTASASANGARLAVTIPGAPLTDNPVDAGFPTATVTADSLGTGEGYAALPDPGSLVQTAPGLVTGLLGQGGTVGLPPIPLPTLPSYPLSVHSVRGLVPTQSIGQGPYTISASSGDDIESRADAGLSLGGSGQSSGLSATSAVRTTPSGSVIAEASSTTEGLALGPLTIGEITSTARMTLATDGTITKERTLEINAARIGSLPVGISTTGLNLAGVAVPVPIGDALAPLLKGAGITLELLPAQDFPDRVIAPAIRITMPVSGGVVGAGDGTVALTIGATTAYLSGAAPATEAASGVDSTGGTDGAAIPADVGTGATTDLPVFASPGLSVPPGTAPSGAIGAPLAPAATPIAAVGLFDLETLYLIVTAAAVVAWALGHTIRFLGVRRAWTSSAG
jgi:hypothetical protein